MPEELKKESALSASRIKTLQACSWEYYAKYKLKLPDKSNDGASRGTTCHNLFECLGNPRHRHHYDAIIKAGKVSGSPVAKRYVDIMARSLNVDDDANMKLIEDMIMNGLHYDFFGDREGEPDEAISERAFDIFVDEDGKRYRIRGFIDKLFLYGKKKRALIRDFKTSKQVFKGKEITDNLQDLMYCLAVKKLYPEYLQRESEFVFLKFDLSIDLTGKKGKGLVTMKELDDDVLCGFEYELTEIFSYMNRFTESDAHSNFANRQGFPADGTFGGKLKCGKDGPKISGGQPVLDENGNEIPAFICPFRKPFEYFAIVDENGETVKSYFTEEEVKGVPDGCKVEKKHYTGCPEFNFINDKGENYDPFMERVQ